MKKLIKIIITLFILLNLTSCNAVYNNKIETKKTEISEKTKIKIYKILEKFFEKLDNKISDKAKKKQILNNIIDKIEILKKKKSDNKKVVAILEFLKYNILEQIFAYNYQNWEDLQKKDYSNKR